MTHAQASVTSGSFRIVGAYLEITWWVEAIFPSDCGALIAQLVELEIRNSGVAGSSPALGIMRQEPPVHPAVNGKK